MCIEFQPVDQLNTKNQRVSHDPEKPSLFSSPLIIEVLYSKFYSITLNADGVNSGTVVLLTPEISYFVFFALFKDEYVGVIRPYHLVILPM